MARLSTPPQCAPPLPGPQAFHALQHLTSLNLSGCGLHGITLAPGPYLSSLRVRRRTACAGLCAACTLACACLPVRLCKQACYRQGPAILFRCVPGLQELNISRNHVSLPPGNYSTLRRLVASASAPASSQAALGPLPVLPMLRQLDWRNNAKLNLEGGRLLLQKAPTLEVRRARAKASHHGVRARAWCGNRRPPVCRKVIGSVVDHLKTMDYIYFREKLAVSIHHF